MKRTEVLSAARQAVTIDRAATHGNLEDSFGQIARVWSARLGVTVTPAQVCILLADLKGARAWCNPGHADNWVDLAGYAACGGELSGEGVNVVAEQFPDRIEDCPREFSGQVAPADDDAEGGGAGPSGAVMAEPTAAPDQGQCPHTAGADEAQAPPAEQAGGALPPSDVPATTDELAPLASSRQTGALNRGVWSESEDAKAIRMRVAEASPAEIAKALHRPVPATEFRVYKTLRNRIEAARENREGGARPNAIAIPAAPGAGAAAPAPATLPADAAAGAAAEAAPGAEEIPQTTLEEHLDALPDEGWTLQDDLDLMNAARNRMSIPDLEELFGVKVAVLRKRKAQLTDGDRFTADQVLAELQARADARA